MAPAGRPRPAGPPDLQEVEKGVEPGPERRPPPGPHEPRHDRFPRCNGPPHQFGVEDGLEEGRDQGHPEQHQAVLDERGGTEQELSAPDRGAENDDARADDADPGEALWARGWGELGLLEGVEAGAGFGGRGVVAVMPLWHVEAPGSGGVSAGQVGVVVGGRQGDGKADTNFDLELACIDR